MIPDPIERIAATLPNGFHDSELTALSLNYQKRAMTLELLIWIGKSESSDLGERERREPAVLIVSGLDFCVIERPDFKYPYLDNEGLTIQSGSGNTQNVTFFERVPDDAFGHWFFVNQWNSFIYFVARDVQFESTKSKE